MNIYFQFLNGNPKFPLLCWKSYLYFQVTLSQRGLVMNNAEKIITRGKFKMMMEYILKL